MFPLFGHQGGNLAAQYTSGSPAAAINTNQVLSKSDSAAQYRSENNGIQGGAARSPDTELKSETFALLFGFLHSEEAVEQKKKKREVRHDSIVSLVPLLQVVVKQHRPARLLGQE